MTDPKSCWSSRSSPHFSSGGIPVGSLNAVIIPPHLVNTGSRKLFQGGEVGAQVLRIIIDGNVAAGQFAHELDRGDARDFGGAAERDFLALVKANGDVRQSIAFGQV